LDNTFENHHPIGILYIEGHDRGTKNTMVVYGRRKHLSGVWGKVSQKQSEGLFAQNRRYLSVCCYQTLFHVFLFTNCKKTSCYIYQGISFQANDKRNTTQFRENTPLGIIFFLCLWKLHLIFFRNLQQNSKIWVNYMNTGLCKIMFSNMTLKYNKLWFFYLRNRMWGLNLKLPYLYFYQNISSSYFFKSSQQFFVKVIDHSKRWVLLIA